MRQTILVFRKCWKKKGIPLVYSKHYCLIFTNSTYRYFIFLVTPGRLKKKFLKIFFLFFAVFASRILEWTRAPVVVVFISHWISCLKNPAIFNEMLKSRARCFVLRWIGWTHLKIEDILLSFLYSIYILLLNYNFLHFRFCLSIF